MKPKHITAYAAISLIWGSLSVAQPPGLSADAQMRASALSCLLAALILALAVTLLRLKLPNPHELVSNAALGITLIAVPHLCSLWAGTQVSPGLAFILFAATPLVTSFLCDAPWSARNAGVAGIAGVTLLAADTASTSLNQWAGVLALLTGLFATAGSLVFARKRIIDTHPVIAAAIQLFTAGATLLLTVSIFSRHLSVDSSQWYLPLPFLFTSAAAACAAYPLYYWLLRAMRPDQLSSTVWGQFIVSVIGTILIYRIHPQWRTVAGLLIMVAALMALTRSHDGNRLLTVRVTPLPK